MERGERDTRSTFGPNEHDLVLANDLRRRSIDVSRLHELVDGRFAGKDDDVHACSSLNLPCNITGSAVRHDNPRRRMFFLEFFDERRKGVAHARCSTNDDLVVRRFGLATKRQDDCQQRRNEDASRAVWSEKRRTDGQPDSPLGQTRIHAITDHTPPAAIVGR